MTTLIVILLAIGTLELGVATAGIVALTVINVVKKVSKKKES